MQHEARESVAWAPRPPDEDDTAAEVDAAFRTQRRIAVAYMAVFATVLLAVPIGDAVLDWWTEGELIGAMSPSFAMAAGGLYLVFLVIALAGTSLANAVEDRMLGGPTAFGEEADRAAGAPRGAHTSR